MATYRVKLTLDVEAESPEAAVEAFYAALVADGEKVFRVTPWDTLDGSVRTVLAAPGPR